MQDLITSFIIQSKECKLRDIGRFRAIPHSAEHDIANKKMVPPSMKIEFSGREDKISDDLIKYISVKRKIPFSQAQDDLKKWCSDSKAKLKNGEEIVLEPIGRIKKNPSGNMFYPNQNAIHFFEPVPAVRVIHKNSEHAVLVGDRETTSAKMSQYYHEEPEEAKSNTWKIISIILLMIAILLLFIHFYQNSFSLSTIGNQHKIIPQTPPQTYSNP